MVQQVGWPFGSAGTQVQSLARHSGYCHNYGLGRNNSSDLISGLGGNSIRWPKKKKKKRERERERWGVPVVAQWLTNPSRNHEVAGLIPGYSSD